MRKSPTFPPFKPLQFRGKTFHSRQSFVNTTRKYLKDEKEKILIFLELHPVRPLCFVCSSPCRPKTITKGWDNVCENPSCYAVKKENSKKRSVFAVQNVKDFKLLESIKSNVYAYTNALIKNNTEPSTWEGRVFPKFKMRANHSRRLKGTGETLESLLTIDWNCRTCDAPIKLALGETYGGFCSFVCGKKHASFMKYRNHVKIKKQKKTWADDPARYEFVLFRGVQVKLNRAQIKKSYQHGVDSGSIPTDVSCSQFLRELTNVECKVCHGNMPEGYMLKILNNTAKRKLEFCSMDCYHTFRWSNEGMSHYPPMTPEAKQKASARVKARIARGEFTPSVTSTWAHSRMVVDGIPFRSSWDASFYVLTGLEYEKVRIPYVNSAGVKKNYIVDFHDENTLYEIKPSGRVNDDVCKEKAEAAKLYSLANGKDYVIIDETYFKTKYETIKQVDPSRFLDQKQYQFFMKRIKVFE